MHNFLSISLNPALPASLRNIPVKYNIIVRLWTHGFHKLLESLRCASFHSTIAQELLIDFIYYAYNFYAGLLDEPNFKTFKGGWLEALGDLARYRMAVAAMISNTSNGGEALTLVALSSIPKSTSSASTKSNSNPSAHIDGSPSPSVGVAAAKLLDVEPEKEHWRILARDWYSLGLADTPGVGKLHHHLGLLSRDVESEEMRGVYHFVKRYVYLFVLNIVLISHGLV
jgi:protein SMG6